MTDDELRSWADTFDRVGSLPAAAVLRLFADRDRLARECDALRRQSLWMADRIHAAHEVIGRRAERRAVPRPEPVELMRLADDGCPLAEAMA